MQFDGQDQEPGRTGTGTPPASSPVLPGLGDYPPLPTQHQSQDDTEDEELVSPEIIDLDDDDFEDEGEGEVEPSSSPVGTTTKTPKTSQTSARTKNKNRRSAKSFRKAVKDDFAEVRIPAEVPAHIAKQITDWQHANKTTIVPSEVYCSSCDLSSLLTTSDLLHSGTPSLQDL
jgi:hypothetical protein